MQDQPLVVVMDGWCLREKSKVFLKLFFGDTMWLFSFFSFFFFLFPRFMQNSRN